MVGIDVSHQVEALEAVLVVSSPLVVGVVLVLRESVDAGGVSFETRERVLGLSGEPASGGAAKG